MNAFDSVGTQRAEGYVDVLPVKLSELPSATRLIDVREPAEFAADHLEGAESVPLATIESEAASWNPSEPLLLICRSGRRSVAAAIILKQHGFDNLGNLLGGMMAARA